MKTKMNWIATLALVASLATGVASAHSRPYAQTNLAVVSVSGLDCGPGSDPVLSLSVGGFCIPAGDFSDPVTITIDDDVNDPVGGTACQVLVGNLCSPLLSFCGVGTVSGLSLGTNLLVFLQRAAEGNPVSNAICPGEASFATVGVGLHS